jgi:hypothetical protein
MADAPPAHDDPTERQLIAYNARNADAFVQCYTHDVVVDGALGEPILKGREALDARYRPMFAAYPDLHCEVVSRIHVGAFVIHEERVTGRQPNGEHVVAIYRVVDGLIAHVRFLR